MGLLKSLFGKKKQDEPYPSWAGESAKMKGFLATITELANHKNIPEKFLADLFTDDYGLHKLMFTAGLMEQQGFSYDDQVKAVMNKIEDYWLNCDDKHLFC